MAQFRDYKNSLASNTPNQERLITVSYSKTMFKLVVFDQVRFELLFPTRLRISYIPLENMSLWSYVKSDIVDLMDL